MGRASGISVEGFQRGSSRGGWSQLQKFKLAQTWESVSNHPPAHLLRAMLSKLLSPSSVQTPPTHSSSCRLSKEGRSPKKQLWVFIFDWRSILFLTTSSWRLFLAPGEKVTSFFDLVLIIGLSVSGGGEKTMLMRSGVQCPRGSFNCPFVLWPKVYILYLCPATVMTIEIGREGENVETL